MSRMYFSHARGALAHGLQLLRFEAASEILLPDYICSIVPDVIKAAGLIPRYYEVDQSLRPDWETVRAGIGLRTRALLIVHYFGVGQNIDECKSFCREHAVALIEDNAHGFGAVRDNNPLGSLGDIGISSPRKVLAIRNGGILYQNRLPEAEQVFYPTHPGKMGWKLRQMLKKAIRGSPAMYRLLKRKPNYLSEDIGRETVEAEAVWSADAQSIRQIEAVNWQAIREGRQACWQVWRDWSESQGLTPVFATIHPGDSPISYAVRVGDMKSKIAWFDWGWNRSIDVHSWPALPREVIRDKRSGFTHWAEIICFPISAEMAPDELRERLGM